MAEGRQRLLYAAITDLGDSIRANDEKAYAALVLHGLVLAGVTGLVAQLGDTYVRATVVERVVALVSLGTAFAAFLASALCLVSALTPRRPKVLDGRIGDRYKGVFFPTAKILNAREPHLEMSRRLDDMGDRELRDELVAETLKLADILRFESVQTKRGYRLIYVELVATSIFFVVVAASTL